MSERDAPGLPPCGIYRTAERVGAVPAGRLVYFHNHGDPGPGLYLPSSWRGNQARFEPRGHLLPDPSAARSLEPLVPQGFYRVGSSFHCCEKRCRRFETDSLVQLGYDGAANPILFTPEWVDGRLVLPDRGTRVDGDHMQHLHRLRVPVSDAPVHDEGADPILLH